MILTIQPPLALLIAPQPERFNRSAACTAACIAACITVPHLIKKESFLVDASPQGHVGGIGKDIRRYRIPRRL